MNRIITILGYGYTGSVVARMLRQSGESVVATTREASSIPPDDSGLRFVRFDLDLPGTWQNIPKSDGLVWTFPAAPLESVRTLWRTLEPLVGTCVVIGTTSAYLAPGEGAEADERAPIDRSSPRVEGEEYLRGQGATILRSAGIYGPGRNPLDWLRRGSIASGEKIVNLVHVEDLAISIIAALEGIGKGEDFIVSDGSPKAWGEIARWGIEKSYLGSVHWSGTRKGESRRLLNRKLLKTLSPPLRHLDLFRELELLERPVHPSSQDTSPAP